MREGGFKKVRFNCWIILLSGDNFRAAARMPYEQTSYSILNIKKLINSPNGQFISTLWKGKHENDRILEFDKGEMGQRPIESTKGGLKF